MGATCSNLSATNFDQADYARRNHATITLGKRVAHPPDLPATEEDWVEASTGPLDVSIAASTIAGTSLPHIFKHNQDRFFVKAHSKKGVCVFAVVDGHGNAGFHVSRKATAVLEKRFEKSRAYTGSAAKKSLTSIGRGLKWSNIDTTLSGCSASICVLAGSKLTCGNVGDCRVVLGYRNNQSKIKTKQISVDHYIGGPGQRLGFSLRSRYVGPCRNEQGEHVGPARLWNGKSTKYPGTCLSHSLGDSVAHRLGASSKVDTNTVNLGKDDECVIIASGGVWKYLDPQEVVQMAMSQKSATDAADFICREAAKRWNENHEVHDDVTAVVAFLSHQAA